MKVLHIANNFTASPLYTNLMGCLADIGFHQKVYCPIRSKVEPSQLHNLHSGQIDVRIENIIRRYHRIMYRSKIRKASRGAVDFSGNDIDLIHAHTLYSDGGAALLASERLHVPYVVAVRNVDLNYFEVFRPDLRWIRNKILIKANCIFAISPAYARRLMQIIPSSLRTTVEPKLVVLPNGIDKKWLADTSATPNGRNPYGVVFTGRVSKQKNVLRLAAAIIELRKEGVPATLTVVGSSGDADEALMKLARHDGGEAIQRVGFLSSASDMINIYRRNSIFAMPSLHETFGLVYVEALSQGCPVLHSIDEGVHGFFPSGTVSEAVSPTSIADIKRGLRTLFSRAPLMREECVASATMFSWPDIAAKYSSIYMESIIS
ncbi:glycosyltransferase family 4 protein [Stenotrophomonas sp. W1S232]|uniref:Glycosyltransferase family 4 protein n=1 Tax=Stenotrophomonas koreensis TaxID=266128 RepID=A0A7W3UY28_9GAMM|nr:glycosyltransferase family 4 protein [Stenotrophomonas koreensis]MBB1115965.1 glycosyltransferase family 4 protein [Stenotrophomonas koreensis]